MTTRSCHPGYLVLTTLLLDNHNILLSLISFLFQLGDANKSSWRSVNIYNTELLLSLHFTEVTLGHNKFTTTARHLSQQQGNRYAILLLYIAANTEQFKFVNQIEVEWRCKFAKNTLFEWSKFILKWDFINLFHMECIDFEMTMFQNH